MIGSMSRNTNIVAWFTLAILVLIGLALYGTWQIAVVIVLAWCGGIVTSNLYDLLVKDAT